MNRRWFLLGAAALVVAGGVAEARMHAPYRGHRIVPSATAPLDGFTQPAAAYSFRKLESSYGGPAVRLKRASDSLQVDIGFLGFVPGLGSPIDIAQANAFCAATTCTIEVWYDQSGSGKDAVSIGLVAYVANCLAGLPCARVTGASQGLLSVASQVWPVKESLSAVANRSVGTGDCYWVSGGFNSFGGYAAANNWMVSDNVAVAFPVAAADNVWHAGIGIIDAAASLGRIDGTELPGASVPGATTNAQVHLIEGRASTTCSLTEGIVWGNYALTLSERQALQANQKSFWGTP